MRILIEEYQYSVADEKRRNDLKVILQELGGFENLERKISVNCVGYYYSTQLKLEMINKVLIGNQTIESVSLEYGLTSRGMLNNWIKSYKENGYTIVEKKRGRSPTMKKEVKPIDPNDKDAIIKAKDEEILRLKAENEYLKKLRAVVQARKGQQPKTK